MLDNQTKKYEKLNKKAPCTTYNLYSVEEKEKNDNIEERKEMIQELKIDPELRDLLPPLTQDTYNELEKNILQDGCNSPIALWHGFIADGHNRYDICTKHKKPFETYDLTYSTKDEVMDWMISIQLGRRNITDTQTSYLRGLQYEREKKKATGFEDRNMSGGQKLPTEQVERTSQKLADQHKVSERTIRDDGNFAKAVDKIAENIGIEAKNKILNKDVLISKEDVKAISGMDAASQKKYLLESDEKKVKLPKKEVTVETHKQDTKPIEKTQKIKECIKCGLEKDLDSFYIGHDKCKECEQVIDERKLKKEVNDSIDEIIKDVKTSKSIHDNFNAYDEIEVVEMYCSDLIEQLNEKMFCSFNLNSLINEDEQNVLLSVLTNHIQNINNIINKIKGEF